MQTLNVARGGTLHQALSTATVKTGPCEQPDARGGRRPGQPRRALAGDRRIDVNSFHHQAIADVGRGLRPVAWADDGVVEAIEAPGGRFLVGVQWHAEGLIARAEQLALFTAFVDAAREHVSAVHVRAA